jgi:hypothetical protein
MGHGHARNTGGRNVFLTVWGFKKGSGFIGWATISLKRKIRLQEIFKILELSIYVFVVVYLIVTSTRLCSVTA